MNAVLKHLSADLDCHFDWRVGKLHRNAEEWVIERDQDGDITRARFLLITAPPYQTAELLEGCSHLASSISQVPMNPCWALMLGFAEALENDFDAAFDNNGPLSWLSRNSSKPGRSGEAWLLHASADWSQAHLEKDVDWVATRLLQAFRERVPDSGRCSPTLVKAHRWRYALAPEPLEQACLSDQSERLVVAGDWCAGNRIEGAWRSGQAAADVLGQWHHGSSG